MLINKWIITNPSLLINMINQPSSVKVLTNVSIVKLKVKNKKFEIACYPNKVNDYRQGLEVDIEEVLQTPEIYTNVAQGEIASRKALKQAFPSTKDKDEIVQEILKRGQIQINEAEREGDMESMKKKIAAKVVKMAVNTEN